MTDVPRDPHKAKRQVPLDYVSERLEYRDGLLIRKVAGGRGVKPGDVAGTKHIEGYIQVNLRGQIFLAHQIVFAMHHGWTPAEIDHINGDRADNRIENLRAVSRSQNLQNAGIRSDNTSGVRGVSWSKLRNKWHVRIWKEKVKHSIGFFDDLEDARLARLQAEITMFGEYRRVS